MSNKQAIELYPEEIYLISLIRDDRFESIIVKKKGRKINLFECTESIDRSKRISEILQEADYQEISIRKAKGKITNIIRVLKKKS